MTPQEYRDRLDEILCGLKNYKLRFDSFTFDEHYALNPDLKEAKQALYKDMLELIGGDEPDEFPAIHKIAPRIRNQLRQELRTKLKEYYGIQEVNNG